MTLKPSPPSAPASAGIADAKLRCPQCGYNLTGLVEPRCPECGTAFDAAALASGVALIDTPSRIDTCDVWQPHAVLWAGLVETITGCLFPWRIMTYVSLRASVPRSVLLFLSGLLWLGVALIPVAAAAIVVLVGASPGAAVKTAALVWLPWMLAIAAVPGVLCAAAAALLVLPWGRGRGPWRPRLRTGLHWLVVMMAWGSALTAGMWLLSPAFARVLPWLGLRAAIAITLLAAWLSRGRRARGVLPELSLLLLHLAAFLVAQFVAEEWWPGLNPPMWVYLRG